MKLSQFNALEELVMERNDAVSDLRAIEEESADGDVEVTVGYHTIQIAEQDLSALLAATTAAARNRIAEIDIKIAALGVEIDIASDKRTDDEDDETEAREAA